MPLHPDEPRDTTNGFAVFDDASSLIHLTAETAMGTRAAYTADIKREGTTYLVNELVKAEGGGNSLTGLVNHVKRQLIGLAPTDEQEERELTTISIARAVVQRVVQDNLWRYATQNGLEHQIIATEPDFPPIYGGDDEYDPGSIESLEDLKIAIQESQTLGAIESTRYVEFIELLQKVQRKAGEDAVKKRERIRDLETQVGQTKALLQLRHGKDIAVEYWYAPTGY